MRSFITVAILTAFLLLSVSCSGSATSGRTDKDNAVNDENQTDSENDSDGQLNDESEDNDDPAKTDDGNDSEDSDGNSNGDDSPDSDGSVEPDEDVPVICEAGVRSCRENTVIECNDKGTVINEIENCTGVGVSCYKGECLDECGIAAKNQGYLGCEYWGAFLQQSGGYEDKATYALVVANPNATKINVKVFTVGDVILAEHDIEAGELYSFELGTERRIQGPGISDLAFKLVSTRPVAVTQMNPFGNVMIYSNDATLLFQKGALGTQYYAMSWPSWSTMSGFIAIVAVEDGTTSVTVNYAASTKAGTGIEAQQGGDEVEYSLTKYQILTLNSTDAADVNSYGADLTGSFIISNKKVAVFGGHVCARIPADKTACDHLEHQIFPLQSWGKKFTAARTKPRGTELDHYRILASDKGASVAWSGGTSGSKILSAGEFYDMSTDADFVINSSEPVMVGQFLASQDAGATTGDPSMMLVAPDEQLRKEYVFLVPPNYDNNRITIVASADTNITVNETSYSSNSFDQIPDTDRLKKWIELETGPYTLEASKPVALYVYGYSQYVSYAYTAGLDLTTINPVEE